MAKSIKYRFDEVMLRYVKELSIKTTAFGGYDRDDVYEKIKELISQARKVCEDVYEEAVSELGAEAAHNGTQLDQAQIDGLLEEVDSLEGKVAEFEAREVGLQEEVQSLQQKLSSFDESREKLERANEILHEARLEADRIISEGREKGEQEVLLGRAKSRNETEEAQKHLDDLRAKSQKLQDYLRGGEDIQRQIQAYADSLSLNDQDHHD
ncbi:MAG: hypothetical protein WCR98_01920 [Saccharofermentanales bacterium]|jgi:cell division septum initiation protein DivIVA|nr:hypothetical protein [Eubacteriales bacterium]MDD3611422.1 hypothetical protein [Eubacteriales bacterium]HHU03744.1 hypothetical protein [Fastidiosipila sp.]